MSAYVSFISEVCTPLHAALHHYDGKEGGLRGDILGIL